MVFTDRECVGSFGILGLAYKFTLTARHARSIQVFFVCKNYLHTGIALQYNNRII